MENMKVVYCEPITDYKIVKALTMATVGKPITEETLKEPSEKWLKKLLSAEHSPIRAHLWVIQLEIPYWVSVHLVRHKIGVEHFVSTQRNDRQENYDRNAARQDFPVLHAMLINDHALINISRKRLCMKASPETRQVWQMIKDAIREKDPILADMMVKECDYRGGVCHEMKGCGIAKNIFEEA